MNELPNTDTSEPLMDILGLTIDAMPDAMIVADTTGVVVLANDKANQLFGGEEGYLVGEKVTALVARSDLDGFGEVEANRDFFHDPSKRPLATDISIELSRSDGSSFSARINLKLVESPAQEPVVVCSLRDVSERRAALAEMEEFHSALEDLIRERTEMLEDATNKLQRQTEALEHILDSMGEGVVVIDQEGRFEFFNAAAERMLGKGITDERPDHWPHVYGIYSADEWTALTSEQLPLVRALRGESVDNAMMFIRNDGIPEGRHISVTARPLLSDNETIGGAVAVFRDVTSQKRSAEGLRKSSEELERRVVERTLSLARANRDLNQKIEERRETEDALRVSERQLRLMADSLPLLVAYVDAKHRYLFVNTSYEEWFGLKAAEVAGKPVWEVVGVERYKQIRPLIDSALQGNHVLDVIDIEHRVSGTRRVQMNLVPDVDDRGHVQGFYAVGIDLTERSSE